MFRASLCPSAGEQDHVFLHMVFCTGCAGCGCVELCHKLCALCTTQLHTTSQHNQCRTPYAVIHGLVLLMMGIMMPEICWDGRLIINIGFVATFWFISLHPTFHDARSQEPKTWFSLFPPSKLRCCTSYAAWSFLILITTCCTCSQQQTSPHIHGCW